MKIRQYRLIEPNNKFWDNTLPGVEFDVTDSAGEGHGAAIIVWGERNVADAIALFEALGAVRHVGGGVPLDEKK